MLKTEHSFSLNNNCPFYLLRDYYANLAGVYEFINIYYINVKNVYDDTNDH